MLCVKRIFILSIFFTVSNLTFSQTWQKVEAGTEYTLALKSDSSIWVAGSNLNGQLGQGTTTSSNTLLQIGMDTDWTDISAGAFHVLALKSDGTIWGCGANAVGQIGTGATSSGETLLVQIGTDADWEFISAGQGHSIALKTNGTMWSWGFNSNGQVGVGTITNTLVPEQIGSDADWLSASAGGAHSLGIKNDGSLWAWGLNANGQLGLGTSIDQNIPSLVDSVNNWIQVSAGFEYSIGLQADNTIWGWGFNGNSQLGNGSTNQESAPIQIGTDNDWSFIAAGSTHSFGIKNDKSLYGWGFNNVGQLGNGITVTDVPSQIGTDMNWEDISAAEGATDGASIFGAHSVGLKSDKKVICTAGANYIGQLGDGTFNDNPFFNCESGDLTLDIIEQELPFSNISVFPNPSNGIFKVDIEKSDAITDLNYAVYTSNGTKVLDEKISTHSFNIDATNNEPGIYFLIITDNTGQHSTKLVIR